MNADRANARLSSVFRFLPAMTIISILLFGGPPGVRNVPLATSLYAGWEEDAGSATGGGISATYKFANGPSLTFDPDGRPVVAWTDTVGDNPEIYLKRVEGSAWVGIGGSATGGGISNTDGNSSHVSMKIDSDGQPIVAWCEILSDGNQEIYVKHWNGTAWVGMNGSISGVNISGTPGASDFPRIAIDHLGRLIVTWTEYTTNGEVYVKRWNGSEWEALAGSASSDGISNSPGDSQNPTLAIDSIGRYLVAWSETTIDGDADIFLKRWNGTAWEEMDGSATGGGISQNVGGSYRPSLAVNGSGEIAIAWEDDSGAGDDYEIFVKRWTGLTWVGMGNHSDSANGISNNLGPSYGVSLATTPDGAWIVAWEDSSEGVRAIYFRIWNGSSWVELESGSATTDGGISGIVEGYRSTRPALAAAPDGTMMVAWEWGGLTNSEIYARRYQPPNYGGWQAVGGSASGGGISDKIGLSAGGSVDFNHDDEPIVAWQNNQNGNNEIYVHTLIGSEWLPIGGSTAAGGVSDTPGASMRPSLAIGADGYPVIAWRDTTGDNWEIYLRRWSGSAWVAMDGTTGNVNVSNTAGTSETPWLEFDHAGRPIVAWVEMTTNREIYLVRWNGTDWAPLGNSNSGSGISNSSGDSFRPSVAIEAAGNPVVAWSDVNLITGESEIFVKRWTGSIWVEMGSGSASGGGVSQSSGGSFRPSLAINPDGVTVVAWEDGCDINTDGCDPGMEFEIYARQYDAATQSWKEIGPGSASGSGISNNSGNSIWPTLAIGPDGAPIVAWEDYSNGAPEIYFRRYDGSEWVEAGYGSARSSGVSGSQSGEQAFQPSLAVDAGGRMWVAWENKYADGEADIYARSFTLCFPLVLSHTGQGPDPVALPSNSTACSLGEYKAGEMITLTAEPAAGWQILGWSGTDDDGSQNPMNALAMPPRSHAASVKYVFPIYLPTVIHYTN